MEQQTTSTTKEINKDETQTSKIKLVLLDWAETIAVAFVIAYFVRKLIFEFYEVPTGSMLETIQLGDRIYVDKVSYIVGNPHHGDIAVFNYPVDPNVKFVKRVIGLPGDTIKVENKVLYVNGVALNETAYKRVADVNIYDSSVIYRDNMPEFTVPKDMYFMMGDNRDESLDSRFWGFVPRSAIVGKAEFVFWSKDPNGGLRLDRMFHPLTPANF